MKHPRTEPLKQWWQTLGGTVQQALVPSKKGLHLTFAEMKNRMNLPAQQTDKAPLVLWNTVEIVEFNGRDVLYKACPAARCHKRVDPVVGGGWICPKCSKQAADFEWRYSMELRVQDATQELEVTAFDEVCLEP